MPSHRSHNCFSTCLCVHHRILSVLYPFHLGRCLLLTQHSVDTTRCFHLFCKECIDENLRNRSRKCPACGEKFGQDDVTPVFFN
jgi:hypothetical protein